MLSKVELNNDYVNQIMSGKSDIFKLKHQVEFDKEDNLFNILILDQAGAYYSGIVQSTDKGWLLIGDTEFKRVYPVVDIKTGKIISIDNNE